MNKPFSILVGISVLVGANTSSTASAPADYETLQSELLTLSSAGGGVYQFSPHYALVCSVRSQTYKGVSSAHALLIPEDVTLDLNEGHIDLRLQAQGYGIRLTNRSTIKNGDIAVVFSE